MVVSGEWWRRRRGGGCCGGDMDLASRWAVDGGDMDLASRCRWGRRASPSRRGAAAPRRSR
jgi:hypothetical protein